MAKNSKCTGRERHQKKVAAFVFVPFVFGEKFTTALARGPTQMNLEF
jgi:hypothetical protein